jgi:hypothetical protein
VDIAASSSRSTSSHQPPWPAATAPAKPRYAQSLREFTTCRLRTEEGSAPSAESGRRRKIAVVLTERCPPGAARSGRVRNLNDPRHKVECRAPLHRTPDSRRRGRPRELRSRESDSAQGLTIDVTSSDEVLPLLGSTHFLSRHKS